MDHVFAGGELNGTRIADKQGEPGAVGYRFAGFATDHEGRRAVVWVPEGFTQHQGEVAAAGVLGVHIAWAPLTAASHSQAAADAAHDRWNIVMSPAGRSAIRHTSHGEPVGHLSSLDVVRTLLSDLDFESQTASIADQFAASSSVEMSQAERERVAQAIGPFAAGFAQQLAVARG